MLDILNGLPSIVIGIFIFGLIVIAHQQSASRRVSRSQSSCCRSSHGPRRRCSRSCPRLCARRASRSASAAGGRHVGLTIPASFGGILTGGTLAIARAAGETAPLLFTCALTTTQVSWDPRQPLQSIPLTIFEDLENPDPALHAQAWAAALVLLTFVLVISILSKAALARSRRKLTR